MNQSTDQQLLRDYTERRSDTAFTELVRRHVDLVYSAALRMVRDGHLADDVTQGVFVALANNAPQLADCPALEGWLHGTTRNLAANAVRAEVRRRNREQEAAIMNEILSPGADVNWEHIAPHLDEALGELNGPERDALLLRYFKNHDFRAVGLALGVSDDTAQKRVSRAVEKLREFFSKRKITIGAGSLGILISANAVQSAPVGLVATISAAVLGGTAVTTSTIIAATKTIAMTTLQKTLITAAVTVLAGAGIYEAKQAHDAQVEMQTLQQQQAPLAGQIPQLQNNFAEATNRLADLLAENSRLKTNSNENELLKLRGEVAQLKSSESDPTAVAAKDWLAKVRKLKQHLADTPDGKIPEEQFLTDQDWLDVASGKLETDNDYRKALSELRHKAEWALAGNYLTPALSAYAKDNGGAFPQSLDQLKPYLQAPVDDTMLQRWEIVPAATVPNVGVGAEVITTTAPVDDLLDLRMAIGSNGYGSMDWLTSETQATLKPVYAALHAAQTGNINWAQFSLSDLLPYTTTADQRSAVQKMIDQKAIRN